MLVPSLLTLLLLLVAPGEAGLAQLRLRREARPLLGGLVSDLTSPFLNLFRPAGRDKPRRPRPSVHHHHRPSHSAPHHHHQPAPVYPPPPVHHHAVPEPPAPKPQIQILPAPDLSQSTYSYQPEPPQTYVVEPEEPAVAPAYEPAYEPAKEEPALAPAYEPSYQPAVAPSYEPSNLPTYKTIYYNADPSPPVYEPQTYEPAAVDTVDNLSVAAVITTKTAPDPEEEAGHEVAIASPSEPVEVEGEVEREPKILVENVEESFQVNHDEEGPEIIDLTQSFSDLTQDVNTSNEEEKEEEVLTAGDQTDKKPQIISFTTNQIPNVFAPAQKSNEVISFVPVPVSEPTVSSPASPVLSQEEELVTPILQDQNLRLVVQQVEPVVPVVVQEIPQVPVEELEVVVKEEPQVPIEEIEVVVQEVPQVPVEEVDVVIQEEPEVPVEDLSQESSDFEVIDLRNDNEEDNFALISEDYIDQEGQDEGLEVDLDLLIPDVEREEVETVTEILESVETTTTPNLPQTSQSDSAIPELEAIPPTIASDPVFREIINSQAEEDKDQVKRGFSQYDPRHSRVYAHKYKDEFSNWYYFRRGY